MKAEEILKKNGVLLEDFISSSTHSACLSAMEEYHQSQLQALKEGVEDLGFMEVQVMRRKQSEDGRFSGHRENTIVVEREEVLNLITNLEDNG